MTGRRIEFVSGSRYWALVPRATLSPAAREGAVPASVAARQLESWCSDPSAWPKVLELFESVSGSALRAPTDLEVERRVRPALQRALESGDWVALSGTPDQHPALATPVIRIVSPAKDSEFVMDDTPRMPALDVVVKVEKGIDDVTSTASLEWSAELKHNPRTAGDRHGPNREFVLNATGQAAGGAFSVAFSGLMAGQLKIDVRANVAGQVVTASTEGLKIVARNPARATVQAEIADDVLQRVACHESGQRQFATTPGNTASSPLWSGDNLGGVGLFQITVPQPTHDQVWNWRMNVAAGRARLEQGRRAANNYPRQIRRSRTLAAMLTSLNDRRRVAGRPPLGEIVVPELTPDQVEDDAIRAFNGYGGNRDQFGFPLHEFRLEMAGAELRLAIDEARLVATASWARVPVADRGLSGDPDYVNHVRAANPTCGG
jgi:hypothetical protein